MKRVAVLSVWKKQGILEFARRLGPEFEIWASTGTAQNVHNCGLRVRTFNSVIGFAFNKEALAHLIADHINRGEVALVCVNPMPTGDLGGRAMLAAAVRVQCPAVCDPGDYERFLASFTGRFDPFSYMYGSPFLDKARKLVDAYPI